MKIIALLSVSIAGWAQITISPMNSKMIDASRDNLPSQQLGVDDLVAVSVYDAPELTRTVRVEEDGTIHLPLLENGIKASGLFPGELESAIAAELTGEQILVNPVVKVTVAEYHSRPVSVMGAVKQPLTFQAIGVVTLLDALAKAGGLNDVAGSEILVTRDGMVDHVPVKQLLNDADPAVNYVLHGGEQIRVPDAGKIYVFGDVKKPGAILVRDGTETSVEKVIALAEGLAPFHYKVAYIYRPEASGGRQEIPVALDKILDRKAEDVALQVNDLLYIPDAKHKRLAADVVDKLAGFGSSTASGLIVWH
jgi:polysaccharide biosynthesis/export protein